MFYRLVDVGGVALWSFLVPDKAFVLKFIPPINVMIGNKVCWPVSPTKCINSVFLLCNSVINVVIKHKMPTSSHVIFKKMSYSTFLPTILIINSVTHFSGQGVLTGRIR